MIDFSDPQGAVSYGIAPACTEDDPEVLTWAQKWADNHGQPVYFIHWSGEILKEVWPDV